jgi:hypothetical protein
MTLTSRRTGAVTSVGAPNPDVVNKLAPGVSVTVTVSYNAGSPGSGTVVLTATTDFDASAVGSQAVTVGSPLGIPFGLFGIRPDSNFTDTRWTGGARTNQDIHEVLRQLAAARSRSPRLGMWFNFVAGDETLFFTSDSDHSFNLQAWKDTLDSHVRGPGFNANGTSIYNDSLLPYINDSTLQGTILLDDLPNFTPDPTFTEIEAMAAHMKLRFPTILTAVRTRAQFLQTQAGTRTYTKLDVGWGQYRSDRGTPAAFRDQEIAAATQVRVGLILGINITQGMGPFPPGSAVPPANLLAWGQELLKSGSSDYACGFIMYNTGYNNLSHANMTTLANLAKNHVKAPCKRR